MLQFLLPRSSGLISKHRTTKFNENMPNIVLYPLLLILCSLFTITAIKAVSNNPDFTDDTISINCGSTANSISLTGRLWLPDVFPKLQFTFSSATLLKGSSSSTALNRDLIVSVDPIPYETARISRSQFSYTFQLNPGQKFIRLHFNANSYNGFKTPFTDLFSVEAGPFTLLANFSTSITARALSLNTFVKEYCISIQQSQPFDIVFSPARSQHAYAFINGIEIISLPSNLSYCHDGDGLQVVGQKSVIYIDNTTALELVHQRNIKLDSVSSSDVVHDGFGLFSPVQKQKANNITWKISVDVGFSYLVRLHFSELGLKMAEIAQKDFVFLINHMIVITSAEILQERQNKGILGYKGYMLMMKGHRQEGKRDIFISLHFEDVFVDWHGPIEGFEIFKLSNHENSLASPNPLAPTRDSPLQTNIQVLLSLLGWRNATANIVIAIISLLNIVVHITRQKWGVNFTDEEKEPSTRAKKLCRRFSLAEIQSATDDFHEAFIIGKGGFGKVYKGIIDNGKETVAVKRLKLNSRQGKHEFWTEIEVLSQVRHVNLASLIGYCNERREMILVYEYIACGTLADHLYKLARKNNACSLSWNRRLKICIGAGRGLDYLHTGQRLIHRDVKSSNILLDKKFLAKVSDFGLAKYTSGSGSQSQLSTNPKGTFGYMDPDYFRTHKLTTKSDIYSFGVVLLEVLCGRPAVEPWAEEDKRSLAMWAQDKISNGEVDQIVDPSLWGEISPDSLKAFMGIAERCLNDESKKRPAMVHVVINLEHALELQENATTCAETEKANVDVLLQQVNAIPLLPNKRMSVTDALPRTDRNMLPVNTGQLTMASPNVQDVTSPLKEQINSKMINTGKKDGRKSTMRKLLRLWPWDALRNTAKPSKKKDLVNFPTSTSAPMSHRTSNMPLRGNTVSEKRTGGNNELMSTPHLRIFCFSELKAATRNFSNDTILGTGGFGSVYKGWLKEKSSSKQGSGSVFAVKKLNHESYQGLEEWLSEVNFLGKLSHPNLVKLLGYCSEDKELLLVYEFMPKGSLEYHLFDRGSAVQPLPWDIRLKILIGAARGLAFLHALDTKVIYRDFKTSNILLDESYNAKISDFGLAKMGPPAGESHVSTRIMGTYGYAAPEYIATGHLYVKSDVYGFGVILVEMLTGLPSLDPKRPAGECKLVDFMKPYLPTMSRLKKMMDPLLEGRYPRRCALRVAQLALNCLKNEPKNRPSMQEIVETLERIDSAVENGRLPQPKVHFS